MRRGVGPGRHRRHREETGVLPLGRKVETGLPYAPWPIETRKKEMAAREPEAHRPGEWNGEDGDFRGGDSAPPAETGSGREEAAADGGQDQVRRRGDALVQVGRVVGEAGRVRNVKHGRGLTSKCEWP